MESKAVFQLNSPPVPCVQELAKEPLTTIPPRYIRPDQEQQSIVSDAGLVWEIPVIDMQSLLSEESMEAELTKLDFACRKWGFFQLVNHGVISSLLENVKKEVQGLFNLPMEEKKKYWRCPGEIEGFGQNLIASEEQELDWADLFFIITQPSHLRKPRLFPKLPLPFREALELYSLELKNLAIAILRKLAKALHMETSEMEEIFEEGLQFIRLNYYPPCPQPDKVIGLSPHSDGGALTILLQVNEVEGLQVKKDGNWVPVKPLQNAFIVNVGDSLEIVTNGAYRSVEHRATINSEIERISIATFNNSKYDREIGPARSLISPDKPALFKRITNEEYNKVNEVEGLQVKKDDKWVPIKPLQNAFIVNVGDSLEIVTNGAYRSTEHRTTVNSKIERRSIAAFNNPKYNGKIGPTRGWISQEKPALFKRISIEEYNRAKFYNKLNGKSHLDSMRL